VDHVQWRFFPPVTFPSGKAWSVGLQFEADYQIDRTAATEGEAVARDVLGERPGDWAVRFFWVVAFGTYGLCVKNRDSAVVQLFEPGGAQPGLGSAMRSALRAALVKLER
jgi:hypothetical protein